MPSVSREGIREKMGANANRIVSLIKRQFRLYKEFTGVINSKYIWLEGDTYIIIYIEGNEAKEAYKKKLKELSSSHIEVPYA